MCVGRRSGYPFSGPRSRSNGLACNYSFVNTVEGDPPLWQARMGPAPGHSNHLPGSGFGAARTANHAARQCEVVAHQCKVFNRQYEVVNRQEF